MYVRRIEIDGLKLLRNFELEFLRDGQPRMWTVLVGRNGLCKTSILRAIALAASGQALANQLVKDVSIASLHDLRQPKTSGRVSAGFSFGELGDREGRIYPGRTADHLARLNSSLTFEPGMRTLSSAMSEYELLDDARERMQHEAHVDQLEYEEYMASRPSLDSVARESADSSEIIFDPLDPPESPPEPLDAVRMRGLPHWFVAGYGVSRSLATPNPGNPGPDPIFGRLQSLFDAGPIVGTGFADRFRGEQLRAFTRLVRSVVLAHPDLLPGVEDVEFSESANRSSELVYAHRLLVRTGDHATTIPATWLSHGYQSTLAWLSDLVGQILTERADHDLPLDVAPDQIEGLVLVDELDLHLHPSWQVGLIPALKQTFPRLQFVVTTHSPMLLTGLEADEIIVLEQDAQSGNVIARSSENTPKLSTNSELLARYFGVDQLYPINLSKQLYRYGLLASDPDRSDADEAEVQRLYAELQRAGVAPDWRPVERAS